MPGTECDSDLTAEDGEWASSIDSSNVLAHFDAAGACEQPPDDDHRSEPPCSFRPSTGNRDVRGIRLPRP